MQQLGKDLLTEMYRRMIRIREFEDAVVDLHKYGEIPGSLHTSQGQEAEITGACMALTDRDYMVGNHRSHGHPIAKGANLDGLMAELFAKSTGVCKGKGGSMHLADFSVGSLGETSIVGSGIPLAAGAALGAKLQGRNDVCLCFFGDGASNQGTFHETLNMASIWKLPVIFLCENNQYGQLSHFEKVTASKNIASRAESYSMPGIIVDGQSVLAVYEVVSKAVHNARLGMGPSLIEAKTYRYNDHAANMGRDLGYRNPQEVDDWKFRDPIELFRQYLLDQQMFSNNEIATIESDVNSEVLHAVEFARNSPPPHQDELFKDNYIN